MKEKGIESTEVSSKIYTTRKSAGYLDENQYAKVTL